MNFETSEVTSLIDSYNLMRKFSELGFSQNFNDLDDYDFVIFDFIKNEIDELQAADNKKQQSRARRGRR